MTKLRTVKVNSVQLPSFDRTSLPPHDSDTDTADEDEAVFQNDSFFGPWTDFFFFLYKRTSF